MVFASFAGLLGVASSRGFAAPAAFLGKHCVECHSTETKEGGLDLTTLPTDLSKPDVFAVWERLHDRVAAGEMPPKSEKRPPDADRDAYLNDLRRDLTAAHRQRKETVLRRLNRAEYQNTLNDLFGGNVKLIHRLPEDRRVREFDVIGEALGVSLVQMQRYLECAKVVLDDAIARTTKPPERVVVRASYADTQGGKEWLGKIWLLRDDGAVVFFKDYGYPSGMLREAKIKQEGWYVVRVKGYAFRSEKPITFALTGMSFSQGQEQPTYGFFALPPGEPTTIETKIHIDSHYMLAVTPYGLFDDNAIKNKGLDAYEGPGLAIQSVELEGPLDEFPRPGHRLLFDGLDRREIEPKNPADKQRSYYQPKFELAATDVERDVEPALRRIASKLFRRPATKDQVAAYVKLYSEQRAENATPEEALRSATTALLCSPDFLYLKESPGKLDDYALAARLSYLLTRSAPDNAHACRGRERRADEERRRARGARRTLVGRSALRPLRRRLHRRLAESP
ncbi:MAG: DUF1587 domain-containing protein [Pirellulales bacterium]